MCMDIYIDIHILVFATANKCVCVCGGGGGGGGPFLEVCFCCYFGVICYICYLDNCKTSLLLSFM